MSPSDDAEAALDRIHGLPLSEFTAARNAAAKELAAAGDRDGAERVRAARKPTVAAWAINQLKREDSRKLNAFAKAVAKLEDAQRALIEEGDRDAFAKAGDAHRKALESLVAAALDVAADAGTARSAAPRGQGHEHASGRDRRSRGARADPGGAAGSRAGPIHEPGGVAGQLRPAQGERQAREGGRAAPAAGGRAQAGA